jgi:hypothetical protein
MLAATSLLTDSAIGCSPTIPIGVNAVARFTGLLPSCSIGRTVKVDACDT